MRVLTFVLFSLGSALAPTQSIGAQDFSFILEETDIYYYPNTGAGHGMTSISIEELNNPGPPTIVRGLSMGLSIDSTLATVSQISLAADLQSLNGGSGPGLVVLTPRAEGLTVGIVYDISPQLEFRTYATKTELLHVDLECVAANLQGNNLGDTASSSFINTLGQPPVENIVTVHPAQAILPTTFETGPIRLTPSNIAFVRGDTNGDGITTLADAVSISNYLFIAGLTAPCIAAVDFDNNETSDISDIVLLLSYLFSGGNPPAAPWPDCGVDATPNGFSCLQSSCL